MNQNFYEQATALAPQLTSWRRELHQMPEIGLTLPQTAAFVCGELEKLRIPYSVGKSCSYITATLGHGGKCFLLRSDMDALPVEEETALPFRAKNHCMHACGHDLHTAILLGAAKLLKEQESALCGTVKLFFQPGEETFNGAKAAVDEGILKNPAVDAAFAMHVSSTVPMGMIGYGDQPMSSVYAFKIRVTGKGGHGSQPDECVDPINVGVHLHLALQELISRECAPTKEAVLTIGEFKAGDAPNVIPEYAIMQGTIRTFDKDVAAFLIKRLHEVAAGVATTFRASAEVEEICNVPAVLCDCALNEFCAEQIRTLSPALQTVGPFHTMGSEDFSFLSERVPSSYFALGAAMEDRTLWKGQHNPKVLFQEDALVVGAASYAQVAAEWLRKNSD